MRVLLVSASFPSLVAFQRKFLGLGYIHAYALDDPQIAHECTLAHNFYDSMHEDLMVIAQKIADERPDVIGFACYVWNTKEILQISRRLKELRPEVKIVLGGPEVSYHYAQILPKNPSVDVIVVGEGEETFRELLRSYLSGAPLAGVRGIAYQNGATFAVTPPREYFQELDRIPSPYLSGVLEIDDLQGGACFQTTRGCPFTCTFCDYGRNRPYFEFSTDRVTHEFEFFKENGARALLCVDATFNYKRKRAHEILQMAIDTDLKAMVWTELFPSLIDDELVDLMGKMHRMFCGVGVQTTNPVTMRNIHRIWKPERVTERLDRLSRMPNCYLELELIMGLPGDNLATFKETLDWAYERRPHQIFAFTLQILPHTPLEHQVEEYKIKTMGPENGHEIVSNYSFPEEEIAVGRALAAWHMLYQGVFFRLGKILECSPSDLLERFAYKAYYAGLWEHVGKFQHKPVDRELTERLTACFRQFALELFTEKGLPELAEPVSDFFRYIHQRRAMTRAGGFIMDVLDFNSIATEDRLHRISSAVRSELPRPNGTPLTRIPRLTSELVWQDTSVDMRDMWTVETGEKLRSVPRRSTELAIFTEPKTGAGRAVITDPLARALLELIDARQNLADLRRSLEARFGTIPVGVMQALYESLERAGLVVDAELPPDRYADRVGLHSQSEATSF
ncbi:MAG: radical SAM protein [Planctomycetota bacterium]